MDQLYVNCRVLTLDPARQVASMVRMRDARITQVGSDLPQAGAERVDLDGAWVLPGLIDAHIHLQWLGASLRRIDLSGCASEAEAAARVERAAAQAPKGAWLVGRGWDQNRWQPPAYPTLRSLSRVTQPVLLERIDTHAAWVNSAALHAARIDENTADPPGGSILRDASGAPTGVLIDRAIDVLRAAMPEVSRSELRADIIAGLKRCHAAGLTGVHDMGTTPAMLEVFADLDREGALPLRVTCYVHGDSRLDALPAATPSLSVRGVKLFVDGALGSHGAAMLTPYLDREHEQGLLLLTPEELGTRAKDAHRRGLQLAIHGIGDRAVRLALDAIEAAQGDERGRRHRIEHAQIVDAADRPRFASLGVVPSMQPVHAASDAAWIEPRLGHERLAGAYAWRSLSDGATLAFGSDAPVESESPWLGMHAATSRGTGGAAVLGKEEALTPQEALAAYTTGAAFAAHAPDVGRVAPGYFADFTLVDRDPLAPGVLPDIQVVGTVLGGKRVAV